MPVSVSVPLLKLLVRPPGVATVSVSPEMKPPSVTVALTSEPPLSTSVTVRPLSSATAVPPPVNVANPPAVTVGAT